MAHWFMASSFAGSMDARREFLRAPVGVKGSEDVTCAITWVCTKGNEQDATGMMEGKEKEADGALVVGVL